MKNWEDIFKESLEGCSDSLPEGSLEEFQRKISSPHRHYRLAWIAVPAAAACAALAVLQPHLGGRDAMNSAVAEVGEAIAAIPDIEASATDDTLDLDAPVRTAVPGRNILAQVCGKAEMAVPEPIELEDSAPEASAASPKESTEAESSGDDREMSPVAPQDKGVTWVELEKASTRRLGTRFALKAGGGLLGGAGAGLLACVASGPVLKNDYEVMADMGPGPRPGAHMYSANSEIRRQDWIPFKAAVTARYPLSERLYLMSGLEYSVYGSEVERFLTGEKRQYAHFLSVPLRVDWSALKKNSLELYLGAGASADLCIGARYAGKPVRKNDLSVSLTAACGAMWKFNRSVGIYLEPQLSWCPGSSSAMPRTYRTEHSLVPCAATGIRFTICENR